MLTKSVVIGTITIMEDCRLQVRTDTVIEEDGKELSRTYHRAVLDPGDDVSAQLKLVCDVAGLLWTPDVIDAWKAKAKILRAAALPPAPPMRTQ